MPHIKRSWSLCALFCTLISLLCIVIPAFAQGTADNTEAITPAATPAPAPNPIGWAAMIPAIVPLLIAFVKQVVPQIPRVALPIAAPFLGMLLQMVLNYTGLTDGSSVQGLILGAAGVMLREAVDQAKKLGGNPGGGVGMLLAAGCACLMLTGCISGQFGKSFAGLAPDKDLDVINPQMSTPWGTVKADRISSRVNPKGSNPLTPLPQPVDTMAIPIGTNTLNLQVVPAGGQ